MRLEDTARRVARLQVSRPITFLLAAALLTILAGAGVAQLRFDSSYEALLPEDAARVRDMNEVRELTGGTRQLVVAVGGGDARARRELVSRMVPELRDVDGVRFVDARFPVEFFEERVLLMLDTQTLDELVSAVEEAIAATKWFHNPMNPHLDDEEEEDLEASWERIREIVDEGAGDRPLSGRLASEDGRYSFVVVVPSIKFEDVERGRRFCRDVREAVDRLDPARRGLHVRYAGNLEIVQEQHRVMKSDLRAASLVALVLGVLVVTIFTRRPLAPLAVALPLTAGVTWTFGVVGVTIGHVNVITGFLVAVLIGLGIDFGVHLFVRYQQERDLSDDPREAMVKAVTRIFRPAFTSAATTGATFASFVLAQFRGFSEFGVIAAVGVVFTLLASFLVMPPLVTLLDRGRRAQTRRRALVSRVSGAPPRPLCAAVIAVFCALAAYGATRIGSIRFENDLRELRGESEAYDFFDYVNENLGVGFNPAVVLVEDVAQARRVEATVERMKGTPGGSTFGRVLSVARFLPDEVEERMERVRALEELVSDPKLDRARGERAEQLARARELAAVEPWDVEDLPEPIRRRFTTLDGERSIVYLWPESPNYDAGTAMRWEDQLAALESELAARGISVRLAEETLIVAWIHRLILEEAPRLLVVAALVVLLLLLLDFRSVRHAALVASPLVVGMLVFAAFVTITSQHLNLFNIIVVPSIIGIGIDNSVHIYHRALSERFASVLRVMAGTGVAALLASLTTAVGFGSSLVSHHTGLRSLGILAVTGIAVTFVAATVFFPCLLALLARRRRDGPRPIG